MGMIIVFILGMASLVLMTHASPLQDTRENVWQLLSNYEAGSRKMLLDQALKGVPFKRSLRSGVSLLPSPSKNRPQREGYSSPPPI
ncbi:hypothetical protein Ancab_038340 [Ancistrocladus abbreviatus]